MRLSKALLLIVTTMGCSTLATAQVHGIVKMDGGLGTAQNKADVTLYCELPGITINPFVGIAGVDKEQWNLTTDRTFIPIVGDYPYRSTREVEYEGHTLYYGADFKSLWGKHRFEGKFVGNNVRMDGTGTLDESWTYSDGSYTKFNHLLKLPSRDADIYNGEVSYKYLTGRKGENIQVGYKIQSRSTTANQNEENTNSVFSDLWSSLFFTQDAKEVTQNVLVNWTCPLGEVHTLKAGVEYEDRHLSSFDHHDYADYQLGSYLVVPYSCGNYTTEIDYRTNTLIYRLGYDLKKGPVIGHLGVDYQHYEIRDFTKRDDIVPMARLTWKMNDAASLTAQYAQRVIRPDFNRLNPFLRITAYNEYTIGNLELIGMHVNNASLRYDYKKGDYLFNAVLSHIFCDDGFNALWYEGQDISKNTKARFYRWSNEGKRRAWSVSPDFTWSPSMQTKVYAKGTLIWDKRVADAINMAYEHWGVTAEVGGTHEFFGKELYVNAHARYSEGNTLDLYSHEGRSMKLGGFVDKYFLNGKLGCKIAYDYTEYARIVIVQGVNGVGPTRSLYGWTGSEYRRPKSRHNLTASVSYSF